MQSPAWEAAIENSVRQIEDAASVVKAPRQVAQNSAKLALGDDVTNVKHSDALWRGNHIPAGVFGGWVQIKGRLQRDPKKWDFWLRWYQGYLDGQPTPQELEKEIVEKLPSAVWTSSPEELMQQILEIERAYYTSVAPNLVQGASGKWEVEPDVVVSEEGFAYAIEQVTVALDVAIEAGTQNGITENSHETVLIQRAVKRYSSSPSIIATSFWQACMSLEHNIGDIYPNDTEILSLKNSLFVAVEELCELDPKIKERVGRLAALTVVRPPSVEERADLERLVTEVETEVSTEVANEIEEAVEIVVQSRLPPKLWAARLVNWVTVIGRGIEKGQKAEKKAAWLINLGSRIAGWFFKEKD